MAQDIKYSIIQNLRYFENFSKNEVYDHRKAKFLKIGRDKGFTKSTSLGDSSLGYKESFINKIKRESNKNKYLYLGLVATLIVLITIFGVA